MKMGKMRSLQFNLKSTILTLRWLTVLLVVLLMVYSRKGLTFGTGAYVLAVLFFASNIVLTFTPADRFRLPGISSAIVVMDAIFVSLAIYLTSGFATDFYLVYFLVIFVAAMRQELKGSILAGLLAIVFYGWLVARASSDLSVLSTQFLTRSVFLLLVATFSGLLAQMAKAHEKSKRLARDLAKSKARLEQRNLRLKNEVRERTQQLDEAQEQLLRAQRLATIGQLAASVGHELRVPLAVLRNSIYFLTLKLKDEDEKVKKHLFIMNKELSRSDKIISDLLEFSRKKKPTLAPIDLNGVVEEALMRLSIPEDIEFIKNLGDVPRIIADAEQLQAILLNLISNGIQAMPEGGTLTVKTGQRKDSCEITVSDTGVGIREEDIEKIFEPLYTTRPKGIGLGLSITKSLVENHGGTVTVESEVNKGSAFTVLLPLEGEGQA